ncbi:MAG: pyridoxamine 5'-phosphate oxidase family protein [Nitrospirota bacterium]
MKLKDYLEANNGISILSTADRDGKLTTAIYSKPRVLEDNTVLFIMRERLTYHYLKSNPHAAYLFIEERPGYQGIRLFLKKIREDDDPDLIARMTRRNLTPEEDEQKGPKHLVIFGVEMILPLVGAGKTSVTLE